MELQECGWERKRQFLAFVDEWMGSLRLWVDGGRAGFPIESGTTGIPFGQMTEVESGTTGISFGQMTKVDVGHHRDSRSSRE
jgi:hypothetical protein